MGKNYQGVFLRKEEAEQEHVEELFDEELKKLGVRYRDTTTEPTEPAEAAFESVEEQAGCKDGRERFQAACALVAGVGLLLYMVMAGKIDTAYGLVFTSAVSAACGYRMK